MDGFDLCFLVNSITFNPDDHILGFHGVSMMQYNEKELEFLRILCSSKHKHVSQDYICDKLIEANIITPDEFKAIKKKLLYSGVIGIVYGNITVEDESIIKLVIET